MPLNEINLNTNYPLFKNLLKCGQRLNPRMIYQGTVQGTTMHNSHNTVLYQKLKKKSGAQGENRTLTPFLAGDFESPASTVPPLGH